MNNAGDDISARLDAAFLECERLRDENTRLKRQLGITEAVPAERTATGTHAQSDVSQASPSVAKIALFRSLFRGRDDVYAVRWENPAKGKHGYAPAYVDEWGRVRLGRPKAADEPRNFLPITDSVIEGHLTGKHTIGVYPLRTDETCWFLAADFDKKTWEEDASEFLRTCNDFGVGAALERSRSGNGGHVWIFFQASVPAALARKLGCALLTRTMERRPHLGMDSYDRFFPSQDTLPKGGFGNLIALPLQHAPRARCNSVFIDANMQPFPDQWRFLSGLQRVTFGTVAALVDQAEREGRVLGVRASALPDDSSPDPWTLEPSAPMASPAIEGPFPETVRVVRSNMAFVEKAGLPPAMINALNRIAAFQNPEFYKTQAMRLPTFGKPRIIGCAEDFPRHVGLPRGCADDADALLAAHGIKVSMVDEYFPGRPIGSEFSGELRDGQDKAVQALLSHDYGILCAPTGFGKTVVAASLIAARKTNTLVIVHRRQLLDQWLAQLPMFLSLPKDAFGQIGGGRQKPTGIVDVAILQSLFRKGAVKSLVAEYGQVIIDECHHVSAFSFEQVLKQVKGRHVVGLTATPQRRDGHHPIIIMQCGPIRHRIGDKEQAASRPFEHVVIARRTQFILSDCEAEPKIQDIYTALIKDNGRNDLIFNDALSALEQGRSPLLLTERTEHVTEFAHRLERFSRNVIVLVGGMGKRQREAVNERLATIPDSEERILVATGRYIGEGFDDARLDTLFLAMPASWRGTLQQYVGRLHRLHSRKKKVVVYDYVDEHVSILMRMYKKRIKGYASIGYGIETANDGLFANLR